MIGNNGKQRARITLALAGLAVALLSFLEPRVPALAELCGFFGGGCRETASFTLLGIPVAFLGVAYYLALLACLLLARSWAFRVVMAGAGVELTFVYAMTAYGIFCPFCLLNLLVVAALVAITVQLRRGWESLALVLLFLVASLVPFLSENQPRAEDRVDSSSQAVALVAGDPITEQELERAMASKLYDARMELYVEKTRELDGIIRERLLHLEAGRLGKSVEEVRSAALKRADPVGPEDVQAFLADNPDVRSSWQGTGDDLRRRVREYLQDRRESEALNRYVDGLRERYDVELLLEEPPLPHTRVALGNSPVQGPEDAPVTVVEFSDYACPACRKAHEITMEIREDFRGKIRWVFKDYPLERHEGARTLAEAARCARDQGMFWEYQDMLFLSPVEPDPQRLASLAEELGMDGERFEGCLRSGRHREDVLADVRAAEEAGVEVTPSFIVNGKLRPGTPEPEAFRALIESELARATDSEASR
jgi:protein-disulfide isomerase